MSQNIKLLSIIYSRHPRSSDRSRQSSLPSQCFGPAIHWPLSQLNCSGVQSVQNKQIIEPRGLDYVFFIKHVIRIWGSKRPTMHQGRHLLAHCVQLLSYYAGTGGSRMNNRVFSTQSKILAEYCEIVLVHLRDPSR